MRVNLKIVVVGPGAVGKTAACRFLTGKGFQTDIMMTIGADFFVQNINRGDVEYHLSIWDLAGQQRFGMVREMYYVGLQGLVLMVDLTRNGTLKVARDYLTEEIQPCTNNQDLRCVAVVGSKSDLYESIAISDDELKILADEVHSTLQCPVSVYKTSAKEGDSITEMFQGLVKCCSR